MSEPLGADVLFEVADAALAVPGASAVEARIAHVWNGLTRFAGNAIHQNVVAEDTEVTVRVELDRRIGSASTNDATPAGAAVAARRALAVARLAPPEPGWPGLAPASALPPVGPRFDAATAAASPAARAEAVDRLLGRLRPGQEGAGSLATGAEEVAIATTAGARHHGVASRAAVRTVVMAGGASGHAEDAARSLAGLDPAEIGERAASTCAAAGDPRQVEPGDWQVVLLPSAVMTLLEHLAFTTFSGQAWNEGRSAFSGRLGATVASPVVSIVDDALDDGALGLPFDGEGTPRTRVDLIRDGVAAGVVHDRASAAVAGTKSTGHGLPAPNPWGPLAGHLVLVPGDHSVEALIGGVERGLLVTRFWYARAVHPLRTLLTGMTRDGTFRIDGGQVGPPVRNLRFNQSILDALASCDAVGDRLATAGDESTESRAPAVRLRSFTFTSASDH